MINKSFDTHKEKLAPIMQRLDAPFYFYDLDKLKDHLEHVNKHLNPKVKMWYACKANPMSAILKVLRNLGFGIDIASKGELLQVLNTGIEGKNIIATGPGKSKQYLSHLLEMGVQTIVIESPNQLKWLNQVANEKGIKINALLRIQLEWEQGKSVLGGDSITPFGMSIDDWQQINLADYPHVIIKGLHAFQWGNIRDIDQLATIWEKTIEQAKFLADKLHIKLEILDLGGGLGIPYSLDHKRIDFKLVNDLLGKLIDKYQLENIWMELGRFSVGECGSYLTKIIDIKETRDTALIVTEGGINHMARVALTQESFPCEAFDQGQETKRYQVHGPLCTALDKLGEFDLPKNLKPGDWLVFHQAGAYGFTESMPYFLCHELAGEVVSYNGDMMIPRPPRESYEWMI